MPDLILDYLLFWHQKVGDSLQSSHGCPMPGARLTRSPECGLSFFSFVAFFVLSAFNSICCKCPSSRRSRYAPYFMSFSSFHSVMTPGVGLILYSERFSSLLVLSRYRGLWECFCELKVSRPIRPVCWLREIAILLCLGEKRLRFCSFLVGGFACAFFSRGVVLEAVRKRPRAGPVVARKIVIGICVQEGAPGAVP